MLGTFTQGRKSNKKQARVNRAPMTYSDAIADVGRFIHERPLSEQQLRILEELAEWLTWRYHKRLNAAPTASPAPGRQTYVPTARLRHD